MDHKARRLHLTSQGKAGMVALGRKNLFAEKTRLLISVGGVAFSVLLIVVLFGLYQGLNDMLVAYVNSVDADIWVAQSGSTDMFHGISLIPKDVEGQLKELPEVKSVDALVGRQVAFSLAGKEAHTFLMGYDTSRNVGGPISIDEGASTPQRGQIIIDRVFARSKGLNIGDRVQILGRDIEVAGISERGNVMVYQYSFVPQTDARELLKMDGYDNYLLVKLNNPADRAAVVSAIDQVPGVHALDKQAFAQSNAQALTDTFLPIIMVLVVIGFGVGVAVTGLTIYTATVEKTREYGVLKATGASNWQLYRVIFEQALISGTLGYAVGAFLAILVIRLAEYLVPSFVVSISLEALVTIYGLSILMSLIASYIPIRRIVKIDPAMVFKS